MSAWWQNFKEAFHRLVEDDDYSSEQRSRDSEFEHLMTSREAMRISPVEKPSQIAVCIPVNSDEEWCPADYIKSDRPVVVNFRELNEEERDQVRNFMIGVIYAVNGTFTKLSDEIFLFAPSEVGIITKHDGPDPNIEQDFFSGDLNPEDLIQ